MNRRTLKKTLAIAALFFGLALYVHNHVQSAPRITLKNGQCIGCNVVLISIDSLRADHMSTYGYSKQTTPFIDAFAKKSLVFDQFYSTAHLTPVSEASVHTGLYPENNGIIGFRKYYALNVKPIAQILKEHGYYTIAHGNSPEFKKFSSLKESFSRGFDKIFIQPRVPDNGYREIQWDQITKKIQSAKSPFFLWVPIGTVHSPFGFHVPPKFSKDQQGIFNKIVFFGNLEIYYDKLIYKLTPERQFHTVNNNSMNRLYTAEDEVLKLSKTWPLKVSDQDLSQLNNLYDDGVAQADLEFSKLITMLKETGHDKDTIIVLESEHGESLGEHKYIAHYDIYDTTTHVPLIINSPAITRPERVDFPTSGVDILPTLLGHLNIKFDDYQLNGKNFLDNGKIIKVRDEVYLTRVPLWETILKLPNNPKTIFDQLRSLDDKSPNRDYAIRTSNWKLIHRKSRLIEQKYSVIKYITGTSPERKEFELYDLKNDPGETTPLPLSANPNGKKLKTDLLKFESEIILNARKSKSTQAVEDYH